MKLTHYQTLLRTIFIHLDCLNGDFFLIRKYSQVIDQMSNSDIWLLRKSELFRKEANLNCFFL